MGRSMAKTFNRRIALIEVPPERYEGQIPITIMYYHGFDFPVLQVITPDEEGRFPWDAACDPTVIARQPLLGTPRA